MECSDNERAERSFFSVHPGGMTAISRWLSVSVTTGFGDTTRFGDTAGFGDTTGFGSISPLVVPFDDFVGVDNRLAELCDFFFFGGDQRIKLGDFLAVFSLFVFAEPE